MRAIAGAGAIVCMSLVSCGTVFSLTEPMHEVRVFGGLYLDLTYWPDMWHMLGFSWLDVPFSLCLDLGLLPVTGLLQLVDHVEQEQLMGVHRVREHDATLVCLAFSPDGRRALSVPNHGPAVLWDLDGQGGATLLHRFDDVGAGSFSPDGSCYLDFSSNEDRALRRAACDGEEVVSSTCLRFAGASYRPAGELRVGPEGRWVSAAEDEGGSPGEEWTSIRRDHAGYVWDLARPEADPLVLRVGPDRDRGWVSDTFVSLDGRRAFALSVKSEVSYAGRVMVWDLPGAGADTAVISSKVLPLSDVRAMAFSEDGRHALFALRRGGLVGWAIEKGDDPVAFVELVPESELGPDIWEVAVDRKGANAITIAEDVARWWQVDWHRGCAVEIGRMDHLAESRPSAVALAPDGGWGLVGWWDGLLKLWRRPEH